MKFNVNSSGSTRQPSIFSLSGISQISSIITDKFTRSYKPFPPPSGQIAPDSNNTENSRPIYFYKRPFAKQTPNNLPECDIGSPSTLSIVKYKYNKNTLSWEMV